MTAHTITAGQGQTREAPLKGSRVPEARRALMVSYVGLSDERSVSEQ